MSVTKSMHITPSGGNIFADLGFESEEATELQANSKRIISGKLAIKNNLLNEFDDAALKAGASIESLRNFEKIAQCKIPTKSELHEIISDSIRKRSCQDD